jgi:hypothetical protein
MPTQAYRWEGEAPAEPKIESWRLSRSFALPLVSVWTSSRQRRVLTCGPGSLNEGRFHVFQRYRT